MAELLTYQQELAVYVVWHPGFDAGHEMATWIYDQLTRDSAVPLSRGPGIPVYLRTSLAPREVPPPIDFNEARHTVVVLLVDDKMVLNREEGWRDYAESLLAEATKGGHRVLPVKLSKNAFSLSTQLSQANFLPLDAVPMESQRYRLMIGLSHDLCRLLRGEQAAEHSATVSKPAAVARPVRIFISHAKKDGVDLAKKIRDYITTNLQLDTFFDQNQIYYGEDFADVLMQNVQQSAILVLQTDAYSTREWCQREALIAKRHGRPVLVLNKIDVGELRSFPYLGNLPVIRYKKSLPTEQLLARLLLEVLHSDYFPRLVRNLAKLFGKPVEGLLTLARTPELLNLSFTSDAPPIIVYPDPPLGNHEVDLLRECNPRQQVTTPLFLLTGEPSLAGTAIALSISEIAPEGQLDSSLRQLGLLRQHLDDMTIDLARFLLASGADLAYGGDLRPGGFTEKLFDMVRLYSETRPKPRIENYLAWVVHAGHDDDVLKFMDCLIPRRCALPADVAAELKLNSDSAPKFAANSAESDYLNARCFTAMRQEMTDKVSARILLGGRLAGYSGRYPGLLEEACLAVQANLPLYLIGAFGGCTQAIIETIDGHPPESLTLKGQFALDDSFHQQDPKYARTAYRTRFDDYNRRVSKPDAINYDRILDCLKSQGVAGISKNNGLTADENRRLFKTTHIAEVIYLVLKGLNQLQSEGRLRKKV